PENVATPLPDFSVASSPAHSLAAIFVTTISPPSKPISTRDTSAAAMPVPSILHVLDQDPGHAAGMDERHLEPEQARPRLGVDQLGAGRRRVAQRGADVRHEVGDVVHPRAAVGEELADGRVLPQRPQELDPALADPHGHRLDPLGGDDLAMLDLAAEETLVNIYRGGEVVHGMADMMDGFRMHWSASYENTETRGFAWGFWTSSRSRRAASRRRSPRRPRRSRRSASCRCSCAT